MLDTYPLKYKFRHLFDKYIGIKMAILKAHSQIPVVGVTERAPGWPGDSKLPGAAV